MLEIIIALGTVLLVLDTPAAHHTGRKVLRHAKAAHRVVVVRYRAIRVRRLS